MSEDKFMERNEELLKVSMQFTDESDRGVTLIIAAHIEECLRRIVESFLIDSKNVKDLFEGPYAPFGSLSGKSKAAFVMGLITKRELEEIEAVRQVRNVFAHEISASFEHPKIEKICRPLVNSWGMIPRDSFLHMATNAVLPLLYRDLELSGSKRLELTNECLKKLKTSTVKNDS